MIPLSPKSVTSTDGTARKRLIGFIRLLILSLIEWKKMSCYHWSKLTDKFFKKLIYYNIMFEIVILGQH